MSKNFMSFDDIPQDVRNNILGVIASNHIDFDPTKITAGVKDTLNFTETKNTNGRLGYNGDTYDTTYRVPDYNGFRIYVNQTVSVGGNIRCLALDFYDKDIECSNYIYMEIDKR